MISLLLTQVQSWLAATNARFLHLFSIIFILLQACSPQIKPIETPIENPKEFSETGTVVIDDKWWESFNDPNLDTIVKRALTANLGLASDWQRFQASLARVRIESSSLFPQIAASAGTTLDRPTNDFTEPNEYSTGVSASYELDLWGRIRTSVQAEEFRAQADLFDYQSAAMTVSAETSITWYQLLSAKKQLKLINEQIKTNEDIVRLIRSRFTSGQIRAVDILRQQQLLESTRDQKIFFETQVQLLKNELAVLTGTPPQNLEALGSHPLPSLSELPRTGLPLELIRRRPDVLRSYNLLLAADRDMASAIRSKYPRLSINAAAEAVSGSYKSLFQDWAYSLAGNLVAPLFYGGRIQAEVDRTQALKNQQLYEYGQTVLISFREVEDALVREQQQKRRIKILRLRLELAQKTNKQLRIEFLNGLSNYLDVLLSLEEEQQLQRELIAAEQELIEYRIAMYRALAGGFETPASLEFLN